MPSSNAPVGLRVLDRDPRRGDTVLVLQADWCEPWHNHLYGTVTSTCDGRALVELDMGGDRANPHRAFHYTDLAVLEET
jgi:hypothetical protein